MPADNVTSSPSVVDLQQRIEMLEAELRTSTVERDEAARQQAATAEILQVINSSPGNLGPVFEAILDKALNLCSAGFGVLWTYDGEYIHVAAIRGATSAYMEFLTSGPHRPGDTLHGRLLRGSEVEHLADMADSDDYRSGETTPRALVDLGGGRSRLAVALRKAGVFLGDIVIYRREVRAFTDKQIALLQSFAAQAVIAMENARLLDEIRQRQAELRVTFDNMGDGVAMFDADLHLAAWNRNFEHIMGFDAADLAERPSYAAYLGRLAERGEFGTGNVEAEFASRLEHTDRELRLERTRPDGTVIEVRRNAVPDGGFVLIYSDITERKRAEAAIAAARDAAEEALEQQTATVDILKVIASSPNDVQPVFDVVVKAAVRLCGAQDSMVVMCHGSEVVFQAHEGPLGGDRGARWPLTRENVMGRAIIEGRTVHVADASALAPGEFDLTKHGVALYGFKAIVAAPLMRKGSAIGALLLRRREAGPYTPRQIELLETFAAQAVIAIENVRLFTELRSSLDQQTATADILKVIASSPSDTTPAFEAVAESANRLLGGHSCAVWRFEGGSAYLQAFTRLDPEADATLRSLSPVTVSGNPFFARVSKGAVVSIRDAEAEEEYLGNMAEVARQRGFRSCLLVPLMAASEVIGFISVTRREPGPFADENVQLLETFAAQSVIAIQNARLFNDLRDSLERLRAAQANLIQSEKMASLGQLTAGIAHEIKNPLNFVNNFAGLSGELVEELRQGVKAVLDEPDADKQAELQETMDLLTGNLARIVEHGRRADGIVKSMLAHSRGGTGEWQTSNLNGLVEEALNLAYHGARAQDQSFNVTLERDFAEALKPIDVVPQDVTRVFLNLFGNGFYAIRKRQGDYSGGGYQPTLRVSTRDLGEAVEIRVRDNGTGIAAEVRDKLFQPFFTTKPTGEGTGLGLSISYDIVTQQHGGSIEVDSELGQYTEFTVRLPRAPRVPARSESIR